LLLLLWVAIEQNPLHHLAAQPLDLLCSHLAGISANLHKGPVLSLLLVCHQSKATSTCTLRQLLLSLQEAYNITTRHNHVPAGQQQCQQTSKVPGPHQYTYLAQNYGKWHARWSLCIQAQLITLMVVRTTAEEYPL
jgi:hypothetical protein